MSNPALKTVAKRIRAERMKPENVKHRKNGAEEMRTMFLSYLHRRVGVCLTCGKVNCPDKTGGSTLPSRLGVDDVLAALNDAAEHNGLERL